MVVHIFNLNAQEAETGRSLCVGGQRGLHSQFQDSQSYVGRFYLKIPKRRKKQGKEEEEEEEKKKEEEEEMIMSNCVGHILTGAWSTPRSQSHKEICVLPYPNPYSHMLWRNILQHLNPHGKSSIVVRYTSAFLSQYLKILLDGFLSRLLLF